MKATWKKLKDDSWGVRVVDDAPVNPGEIVSVTKKDGGVQEVEIDRVVAKFRNDDGTTASLCTVKQRERKGPQGCSCNCSACKGCEHKHAVQEAPF